MGKQVLPTKEYIQNVLKSTTVSVECSYGTEVVLSELYDRIYEKGRADAIDEFMKSMIAKINFEEKWLYDCRSNNPDTNVVFSSLRTYCENRAEQIKEKNE